jgi:hypothetical protein
VTFFHMVPRVSVAGDAIRMDGELLHGSSSRSATYNSPPLCTPSSFNIKHVEVWRFLPM